MKSKQENPSKGKKVAKKAPNKPIYTAKNVTNIVPKAANLTSKDAKSVSDSKSSLIKSACDSASTAFEFDSNFQNYQDCEYESTYLLSDFKTTPAFAEQVATAN